MTQQSTREEQVAEFVRNLARLDDGQRAKLKRNAGKSIAESRQTLFFYQNLLPHGAARDEEAYFLVATLYPFDKWQRTLDRFTTGASAERQRQKPANLGNLGDSFRRMRSRENAEGLDRRFGRLLDARGERLSFQLRQSILRLTNAGTPIDWQHLTRDVLAWDHPDRYVQRSWARAYVTQPKDVEPQLA